MEKFVSIFLVLLIISSTTTHSLAENADERLGRIERMLSAKIELLQIELRNQNVEMGLLKKELRQQNDGMELLNQKVNEQSEDIRVLKRELQNCKMQKFSTTVEDNTSNKEHSIEDVQVPISDKDVIKTIKTGWDTSFENGYPIRGSILQNRIQRNDEEFKRNRRLLVQPTVVSPQMAPVAFYAYLSASEKDPGHHHTIIFDHVVTNAGNGYNVHSGTFIAPDDGLYVFAYSVVAYAGSYMPVELVVNSKAVGATAADSRSDTPYPSASNTLIIQLQAGSTVFLRTTANNDYVVGGINSSAWSRSSFSGWKIQ